MTRLLLTTVLAFAAGACGADSIITDIADEAPGSNCPAGGLKVSTGEDSNENGKLDSDEADDTKYVCDNSSQSSVSAEPAGANCAGGGVKISTGVDADGNGTIDGAETKSTSYVCGSGTAVIAKSFNVAGVAAVVEPGAATITTVTVNATGPGSVLAFISSDLFCTSGECPASVTPPAAGRMWVSDVTGGVAPVAEYDYAFLQPGETQTITRSAHFPVAGAGALEFQMRGQKTMTSGSFSFYRSGLTVVFLPGQ